MSVAGGARPGAVSGPVQQGLKEALIETLTAILSPVQEVRAAAEEQIKVLEVTEGECVRSVNSSSLTTLLRLCADSCPGL